MSRKKLVASLLALALGMAWCGPKALAESRSTKTLVLYYSRTGNTAAASRAIAQDFAPDVELVQIEDLHDRRGTFGLAVGMALTILGWRTDIAPARIDLGRYRRLLVASPIWAGDLPTAMRTFVETNDFRRRPTVVFTTSTSFLDRKYQAKIAAMLARSGAQMLRHFQVEAAIKTGGEEKPKTPGQVAAEARVLVPQIRSAFANYGPQE